MFHDASLVKLFAGSSAFEKLCRSWSKGNIFFDYNLNLAGKGQMDRFYHASQLFGRIAAFGLGAALRPCSSTGGLDAN